MFKPVLLSSTALLTLLAFPARAQVDPAGENVIVTATRVLTPATEVASSVTVIDANEISARQLRSLPDVLATVPGINVVQTGGEGGQTSLFTRGTNSNHTKVLLDGIDISDPSTPAGAVDLGRMLAGDIAKVEVMRGPGSSLYGSDAIGGVVNIITQDGNGPLALSAMAEGGSFDTFNQSASAGGSDGDFHYHASLQHFHAGATPVTPLDQLLPGEARNDDYFDTVTASTKLRYDVTGNFDLGFVGRWSDSLSHITGEASDPVTFASFPSPTQTRAETQQYQTRATAHWNLGWLDQTLGLAYSSTSNDSQDPNFGPGRNSGDRIKLDWQGNIALVDGETLVLGAETYRDAIHQPLSAGISTSAGYAELQSAIDGVFFNSASIRYDDNSRFGDKFTWHVAPAVVIADTGTKFKVTAGTGFKAPSLEQLYQSFPAFFFFANPNLKPETSLGYDLGVEQALGPVTAGVTFFHIDIKNLINSDPTFTTVINVDRARTQGFETFIAWQVMETLNLRADYTVTEADDVTTHLELLRRPRNKASVTASWQLRPNVGVDATLLYLGPWIDGSRDFSVPRLKTGGYATVDLAGHWDVTGNFTLFVRGDNLFDRRYENPVGFLGPGRAFYAGVEAHL